jgi:hypothetical protein
MQNERTPQGTTASVAPSAAPGQTVGTRGLPQQPAAAGTATPSAAPDPAGTLQAGTGDPGALRAFFMANRGRGQEYAQTLGSKVEGELSAAEKGLPGLTQEVDRVGASSNAGTNQVSLDPALAQKREDLLSPARADVGLLGKGAEGQASLLSQGAGPGYTPTMGAMDAWLLSSAGFNAKPYQDRLAALEKQSPYRLKPDIATGLIPPGSGGGGSPADPRSPQPEPTNQYPWDPRMPSKNPYPWDPTAPGRRKDPR